MAQVALDINGRRYDIACDDGQEAHLRRLGQYIDRRVRELASSVGPVGEARLLVMACLLMADELYELGGRLDDGAGAEPAETRTAAELDGLADRLERIAARLETS